MAGHRRYTGLRIVSDDPDYPGRIDQHLTEKLRAVITRRDGVSATSLMVAAAFTTLLSLRQQAASSTATKATLLQAFCRSSTGDRPGGGIGRAGRGRKTSPATCGRAAAAMGQGAAPGA